MIVVIGMHSWIIKLKRQAQREKYDAAETNANIRENKKGMEVSASLADISRPKLKTNQEK